MNSNMIHQGALRFVLAVVALTTASDALSQEIVGPAHGVVLLRNGYVLKGRISREGDYYVIAASEKSEIRLPQKQVEVVADNLQQVCDFRRGRLAPRDVEGHLTLARWALRNDLSRQAANLMLTVAKIQPNHPGIEEIERRLKAANAPAASDETKPRPIETREAIAQANSQISPSAIAAFTSKVQPLLLNHCGNSGCHGLHAKSEFRLLRSPWRTTVTQQITQRNLHSTLKQISLESPAESPLLKLAGQAHGNMETPPLGLHGQRHQKLINDWIDLVAGKPSTPAAQPPTVASRLTQPLLAPAQTPAPFARPASMEVQTPPAKIATHKSAASDDPFDPEVFNQQFVLEP